MHQALRENRGRSLEIAFFGGSFTAVAEDYQQTLLEAAWPFVRDGLVQGIRVSTRPDAITERILARLRRYGVTAVELGAQSMSDEVLRRNQRGHTARQVEEASVLVRENGFSLGLQMMVGLDGDSPAETFATAQKLASLFPDTMRIYPTVVLQDTPLAERFLAGTYQPMEMTEAVEICAGLLDFFEQQEISVIRLGLHDSPQLHQGRLAGPWHPAFRELCDSQRFLARVQDFFETEKFPPGSYWMQVPAAWMSRAVGQKRTNIRILAELGYQIRFVPDDFAGPLFGGPHEVRKLRGPSGIYIFVGPRPVSSLERR